MWTWPLKGIGATGVAMAFLGQFVVMSVAAGWLREDGIEDTNRKWEKEIAKQNKGFEKVILERNTAITKLQTRLATLEEEATKVAAKEAEQLERQQDATELSAECRKCRIPNEWVWVRESTPARKPGGAESGPQSRATVEGRREPAKKGVEAPR